MFITNQVTQNGFSTELRTDRQEALSGICSTWAFALTGLEPWMGRTTDAVPQAPWGCRHGSFRKLQPSWGSSA